MIKIKASSLITKNIFLLAFLAVFITIVLSNPLVKQTFVYDPDEGYESIKAILLLKGFSLYHQIWSDQPPLFTVILAFWFKLFGFSIYAGRLLVFIFSILLLWAFYHTLKNLHSRICAWAGVIFLILSAAYLRLSVSIMIGTPSLSLSMVSIYCLILYRKSHSKDPLILSAILFAFSLQIKFFTIFLLPLFILEIIFSYPKNGKSNSLSSILLWLGGVLAVYLTVFFIFFHFNFTEAARHLFLPHLKQPNVPYSNFSLIAKMMITDYDILLLALIGIILIIKQRKRQFLLPVLWLASALIILMVWHPVWYHYYLLISLPLCWLAGIGISELFNNKKTFLFWITVSLIILAILRIPHKYTRMLESLEGKTSSSQTAVVKELLKYKPYTRWIIADNPIFAFYTGMQVIPELALISYKRSFINEEGEDFFLDILNKYRPELILLNNPHYYSLKIISYIEKNYTNVYQDGIICPVSAFIVRLFSYSKDPLSRLFNTLFSVREKYTLKEGFLNYYMWKANIKDSLEYKSPQGYYYLFPAFPHQHPFFSLTQKNKIILTTPLKLYLRKDIARKILKN